MLRKFARISLWMVPILFVGLTAASLYGAAPVSYTHLTQACLGQQGPHQLAIAGVVFEMEDLDFFGLGGGYCFVFAAVNRGRTVHGHIQAPCLTYRPMVWLGLTEYGPDFPNASLRQSGLRLKLRCYPAKIICHGVTEITEETR